MIHEAAVTRFKTEAEKNAHPIANVIPWDVMCSKYFYNQLTSQQLTLMQMNVTDALRVRTDLSDSSAKKSAFLVICYAHSDLTDEARIEIAQILNLEFNEIAELAIVYGQDSFFEKFIGTNPDLFLYCIRFLFAIAAEFGRLSVLCFLEEKSLAQLPSMIADNDFEAFRCAAANGHYQ